MNGSESKDFNDPGFVPSTNDGVIDKPIVLKAQKPNSQTFSADSI